MRYYDITITDKSGKLWVPPPYKTLGLSSSYTSYVNGQTLGAAQDIELDFPLANYAASQPGAYLRIWGISIDEMTQSTDLAGYGILVKAGMQKGLPLANPQQAGVILEGTIFQAFGNWHLTEMTLDFVIQPPVGTNTLPADIPFNWPANTPLADAIQTSLAAFKNAGFTTKIAISDQLKMSSTQTGHYTTLVGFSRMIRSLTTQSQFSGIKTLSNGPYPGVDIMIKGNVIYVYDLTADIGKGTFSNPTQIAFQDLIGQPTWINPTQINIKTVMRADISVGDFVMLPTNLVSPYVLTTTPAATPGAPSRNKSIFQGKFNVQDMRHQGRYRQADASSWVTIFNLTVVNPPSSASTSSSTSSIGSASP